MLFRSSTAPWAAPGPPYERNRETPEGTWFLAHGGLGGGSGALLPLGDPGWYQLRVECVGTTPFVSEPLFLEPGEHELRVEPLATGSLSGRLAADGTRELFGLEVLDGRGRALTPVRPLPASGAFALRLPGGRYRLRFGSLDELAAGRSRTEVEVEVEAGTETRLEPSF